MGGGAPRSKGDHCGMDQFTVFHEHYYLYRFNVNKLYFWVRVIMTRKRNKTKPELLQSSDSSESCSEETHEKVSIKLIFDKLNCNTVHLMFAVKSSLTVQVKITGPEPEGLKMFQTFRHVHIRYNIYRVYVHV